MKTTILTAAILGLLLTGSSAFAKTPEAKQAKQAAAASEKLNAVLDGLNGTLSSGSSEAASNAGVDAFSALGAFNAAPRSEAVPAGPATFAAAAEKDCWEVCVSWGPLHVCYTWEQRCR